MALERRLARLEAAWGARPAPGADAAFTGLATWLEEIGARIARGEGEAEARAELPTSCGWCSHDGA